MKSNILIDISIERNRQDRIHPNFPSSQRLAILVEEVGEVAKALNEGQPTIELIDELVQVAAVAVRWIEAIVKEDDAG